MQNNKKSRQDAKINQTSGSSVAKSLADGLGAVGGDEYGGHTSHFGEKKGSRDHRKVVVEQLKNPNLQDEEILNMKASMQKIAAKNRMLEFLEETYKRNSNSVVSAKKNDSTKQVLKHTDQMIKQAESGIVINHDALFDFGKKKTKVPLDSFTEYYAYKTEEKENELRMKRKALIEAGEVAG